MTKPELEDDPEVTKFRRQYVHDLVDAEAVVPEQLRMIQTGIRGDQHGTAWYDSSSGVYITMGNKAGSYQSPYQAQYSDAVRRYRETQFPSAWLDFGCGDGQLLELVGHGQGYDPVTRPEWPEGKFDLITLYHVLEHLDSPVETLQKLGEQLTEDGILHIEVPSAKDVLLQVESFRKHTLWVEHRVLHTPESMKKTLRHAGFEVLSLEHYQRYGLLNHIKWLGGGLVLELMDLSGFTGPTVDSYQRALIVTGQTDTFIVKARKK